MLLQQGRNKKDELKILSILTPDIMAHLLEESKKEPGKNVNVEISGDTILLYKKALTRSLGLLETFGYGSKKEVVKDEKDIQRLLNLAFEFVEEAES